MNETVKIEEFVGPAWSQRRVRMIMQLAAKEEDRG